MRTKKKQLTNLPDLSTMMYGKVPPNAVDLEEAVLGVLLLESNDAESEAFSTCYEIIKSPEMFYRDTHQKIYAAILQLKQNSQPTDILSVSEQLRKNEHLDMVGGMHYVMKLTNSVVGSYSVSHHSKIIFQKYVQRKIIEVGGMMINEGYEDSTDAFELLDQVEDQVYGIANTLERNQEEPIDALLVRFIQELNERRQHSDKLLGVTSGFKTLDRVTNGWQKTDLIILAARPSVGKTAFAGNLALNAAKSGTAVLFFSLEMSKSQLIQRMVSSESGVPIDRILKGKIDEETANGMYSGAIRRMHKYPIHIDDTPGLNIFEARAKARRAKNKWNVGLIVLDYLQLMSGMGQGQNREQEISTISRNLKALAKELEVPIIALSQLSREVEKRDVKKRMPQLSDLRESGAIEQDADLVMFMYRPEYYGTHISETGESNVGETHIKIAKHRMGELETIMLTAQLWLQRFVEPDPFAKSPIYNGNGLDFKKLQGNERRQIDENVPDDLPF